MNAPQRSSHRIRWSSWLCFTALVATLLGGCATVRNYGHHPGPVARGNYAPDDVLTLYGLKVVTFNIKFSKKIDHAIYELSETPELTGADIVLLQEVDDIGVDRMARMLAYDYVYYPASVHGKHDRHFGNAVLSKWPIEDSARLDLPHENPKNDQTRTAVWADVRLGEHVIRVYSAHTATVWLGQDQRKDQISEIARHIDEAMEEGRIQRVIVGGDFNSLNRADVKATTSAFEAAGLAHVSSDVEHTSSYLWGLRKATLDHVFAKGFTVRGSGAADRTKASDHLPVWVLLQIEE